MQHLNGEAAMTIRHVTQDRYEQADAERMDELTRLARASAFCRFCSGRLKIDSWSRVCSERPCQRKFKLWKRGVPLAKLAGDER